AFGLAPRDRGIAVLVEHVDELVAHGFALVRTGRQPLQRFASLGHLDILALGGSTRARLVRRELRLIQRLIAVRVEIAEGLGQRRFGLRFGFRDRAVLVRIEPPEQIAADLPDGLLLVRRRRYALLLLLRLL